MMRNQQTFLLRAIRPHLHPRLTEIPPNTAGREVACRIILKRPNTMQCASETLLVLGAGEKKKGKRKRTQKN